MVTMSNLWVTCCCILFWLWRLFVPLWLWNPAFCTVWAPNSLTLLTMRKQISWLFLDQTILVSWLSQDLVLIWLSATLLAKQNSWYYPMDLDLSSYAWRSCIVHLWGVTWVFINCSMFWSSGFGGLLCVQLLVLLLLVVPPVSLSRIPLNIHLAFFSLFLSLFVILRAYPWTLLQTYPYLMDLMLFLPVQIT